MMTYKAEITLERLATFKYEVLIRRSDNVETHVTTCSSLWGARIAFWRRRRIAKKLNKLSMLG